MCNSKGDKGDKGDKATAEKSTSTGGAPKKVEFACGTKKESALKFATVMTTEIIDVDAYEVSELASNEWLTESGASRHIFNDMIMLWDVRQLDTPVIVRQMVGQVPVTLCGAVRIECESESGQVVLIDLHDALVVPDLRVNLLSIQKMR